MVADVEAGLASVILSPAERDCCAANRRCRYLIPDGTNDKNRQAKQVNMGG